MVFNIVKGFIGLLVKHIQGCPVRGTYTCLLYTSIAFAIFMMIKGISKLSFKKLEESPDAPPPPPDIQLLTEIRDLLKDEQKKG